MSQSSETNRNQDEINDPAEALLFIRGIISASRGDQRVGGGPDTFIMAILTLAAGVATWWMVSIGIHNVALPWAIHNALTLILMVVTAKRRGHTTKLDKQLMAIWFTTIISVWIVIMPLTMLGILRGSGFPLITAFIGLGIVSGGILVWNKFEMALGSTFILCVPLLFSIKENTYIFAITIIIVGAFVGSIVERIQYKKLMNAR